MQMRDVRVASAAPHTTESSDRLRTKATFAIFGYTYTLADE